MGETPPAVVVSGINRGANMGVDVHYSGTVSAAFEGVILGYPGHRHLTDRGNGVELERSGGVRARADRVGARQRPAGGHAAQCQRADRQAAWSAPDAPGGAALYRRRARAKRPGGKTIYWIGGGDPVWEPIPGTDFNEVGGGWISVTPLGLDMTGPVSRRPRRKRPDAG